MATKNDHTKYAQSTKKTSAHSIHADQDGRDSALQKFKLAFEYNETWAEAKHSVQLRPLK